jgi:DNA (cytosine-5)-methyltransferase 1
MVHKQLTTFHLFAGAGGGILADLLLDHLPIGACEIEKYPREVLLARQRDGHLPHFPIWDDVCTFDGTPWRGTVDILCGGFPCQDISSAGKGAGITGSRSGLWKEYARIIGEMRPKFVFAENSPLLRTRGLGVVLEDLAAMGYNARWGVLGARDVGAPHKRDRMWILAYTDCPRSFGRREQHQSRILAEDGGQMQGKGHQQTVSAESCSQQQKDLAYTDDNGQTTTEKRRGVAQGGDCCEAGQEQASEPSGLCASEPNGSMAYTGCKGLEGLNGYCTSKSYEGVKTNSRATCKRTPWHTDPADLCYSEMQGTGTLRDCGDSEGCGCGGEAQHASECTDTAPQRGQDCTVEPLVGRVAYGVAHRVDRLEAIGNGQVPQCAAMAFSILSEGLNQT